MKRYRYETHGGYHTRKEANDWKAISIAKKWAEKNAYNYADDEAMRYGGPAYSSYEMKQIAIEAFLLGRDYGRQERAQEKNKVIMRLKKKLDKRPNKKEEYPLKATGDDNGSWTSVDVLSNDSHKVKYDYHLNRWIDAKTNEILPDGQVKFWKYI